MTKRKRREKERVRQIKIQTIKKRTDKMCTSKVSYPSLIEAEGYAKMYNDSRYRNNHVSSCLRAYLCPICHKFHLTGSRR